MNTYDNITKSVLKIWFPMLATLSKLGQKKEQKGTKKTIIDQIFYFVNVSADPAVCVLSNPQTNPVPQLQTSLCTLPKKQGLLFQNVMHLTNARNRSTELCPLDKEQLLAIANDHYGLWKLIWVLLFQCIDCAHF